MKHLVAFGIALLLAGCAATESEEVAQTTNDAEEAKKTEIICTNEHVVGSNFKRRRCRTVEQAEQEREQAQREISSMQRSGMTGPVDN